MSARMNRSDGSDVEMADVYCRGIPDCMKYPHNKKAFALSHQGKRFFIIYKFL